MQAGKIILITALAAGIGASAADARSRHTSGGGGVPELNVRGSCADAQKFSSGGDDKNTAFKGCMQDETNAKTELSKRWSSFKAKDRQDCVEQARAPSPSYVEVLTCLEMDINVARPQGGGKSMPQIGGPVAPGLGSSGPRT
jgi:hypothetical protein